MSSHRAADAANAPRGTASPSLPGDDDGAWVPHGLDVVLRRQRRWQALDRRRPWMLDSTVILVVVLLSIPDLVTGISSGPFGDHSARSEPSIGVQIAFTAALIIPLWWRRRAPAFAFCAITVVSLLQWSLGLWNNAGLSVLIALYSLALHGSLRILGAAVALTAAEVVLVVFVLVPVSRPLPGLFFLLGTVTAASATGLTLRIRRMYLAALEDRARRLEIERDQRAQLTAAAERARLAREMHDILGHNLTVMVGVADGAATLAANRNEQSTDALRILGDTGRQAMRELRRVLGVLREDQGGERLLSPQPTVQDLEQLLARVRAAGLTVTYRTSGELQLLPADVQLTVYRIVQEALTNTLKHAGDSSSADVTVAADEGLVHVRIADSGAQTGGGTPEQPARPADDIGHGLVGIRQRAALYGGTATVGPLPGRLGWLVDVVLDPDSAPARAGAGEPTP